MIGSMGEWLIRTFNTCDVCGTSTGCYNNPSLTKEKVSEERTEGRGEGNSED